MQRIFLLLLVLTAGPAAQAQEYSITGFVQTAEGKEIQYATASLLKADDSSMLQSAVTDDKGHFLLSAPAGKYTIAINAPGYLPARQAVTLLADLVLPDTRLQAMQHLEEVTVTSNKPFIEQGQGRTILNIPANTGGAGTSLLDLIGKSPGVTVDGNGNISMQGKQGVLVLIDNKPTYLSGRELSEYLKSIPAADVAQVELITQPSARYEAEGNAGIINIKHRKNRNDGINGNAASYTSQGVYPYALHHAGINYKKEKLTLFANGSYFYGNGYLRQASERTVQDDNGTPVSRLESDGFFKETFSDLVLKLGTDYDISSNTTAGISVTGNYHPNTESDIVKAKFTDMLQSGISYNEARAERGFYRRQATGNAYLIHEFSKDKELTLNADYLYNRRIARQELNSTNFNEQGQKLPDELNLKMQRPLQITAYSGKADYTTGIKHGIKLEAGIKTSFVSINNDAQFQVYDNGWEPDSARSNHFLYDEHISAVYISADKNFGDMWQLQLGLRGEQTDIKGRQTVKDHQFTRSSSGLFPTAYITFKPNKHHTLALNYGRRIQRPSYNMLNPFTEYYSQYSYKTGNPELRPEYTDNLELRHSYNTLLTTILTYSHTSGGISTVLVPDSTGNGIYSMPFNVAQSKMASLSASLHKIMKSWWELTLSGSMTYAVHEGTLGSRYERTAGMAYDLTLDSQFNFKKGWNADLHINYMPESVTALGSKWEGAPYFRCSLTKKIMKDTASIKLNIYDPLHIARPTERTDLYQVQATSHLEYNSRQIEIGFSCNFGKKTEQKKRPESTMEETKRM